MRQFVSDTGSFTTHYRVKETLAAMDDGPLPKAVSRTKNVIWFSASFPIGYMLYFNQTDAYRMMRDYSMDIRATTQRLAAARVAVYPIDARRFFQKIRSVRRIAWRGQFHAELFMIEKPLQIWSSIR